MQEINYKPNTDPQTHDTPYKCPRGHTLNMTIHKNGSVITIKYHQNKIMTWSHEAVWLN